MYIAGTPNSCRRSVYFVRNNNFICLLGYNDIGCRCEFDTRHIFVYFARRVKCFSDWSNCEISMSLFHIYIISI